MDKKLEQRLKRLEEKVFEEQDEEFVVIDIPGAKFRMKKHQERDEEGNRITDIRYEDAIKNLEKQGCRMWTKEELFAMRNHAIQNLGDEWNDKEAVENLFGIKDLELDEWLFDCNEVAGVRWGTGADSGPFCASLSDVPSYVYYSVGFRCCAGPN